MLLLDPNARPIIAHRGASAEAPENTLEAFRLGLEQGCDAIELDVRLSRDGVAVVIHDPTLMRTTGRP
ncbi:MAG TPA: glycerophosphodiester phosphodiesterase family protein, partial [Gemmatimonadales bacterium]|nr:glycerophosphodiester phosphodiesterase family protein [Gemmatimonadales bacterium]